MIELFKFHWFALRNPQKVVSDYIPTWSVNLGLGVYIFYISGFYFLNPKSQKLLSELLAAVFGISAPSFFYTWIFFNILYGVMVQYYVQPIVVRKIGKIEKESFDAELYRKIIFYSPLSAVIFTVLVTLPLQLISAFLLRDGQMTIGSMIVLGVQGILGIWPAILIINIVAVQWMGLKTHFHFTGFQIVLSMFIIPLLFASPVILILGKGYLSFLHAYLQ